MDHPGSEPTNFTLFVESRSWRDGTFCVPHLPSSCLICSLFFCFQVSTPSDEACVAVPTRSVTGLRCARWPGAIHHPPGSPGRPEVSLLNEISAALTRALIFSPFCQEKKNDL